MRGGTVRKSVPKCRNSRRRLKAGGSQDWLHHSHPDADAGFIASSGKLKDAPRLWTRACSHVLRRSKKMLWTICVILLVLWALGMATSYTAGGLIHVLLVVALVVMVIRLIQGRRILG